MDTYSVVLHTSLMHFLFLIHRVARNIEVIFVRLKHFVIFLQYEIQCALYRYTDIQYLPSSTFRSTEAD